MIADCRKKVLDDKRGGKPQAGLDKQPAVAFTAMSERSRAREWVLDSGASHHLTGDLSQLCNVREVSGVNILFGNNQQGVATKCGDISLKLTSTGKTIRLLDVLYFPEAAVSLLSLTAGAKSGVEFEFRGSCCVLRLSGVVFGKAQLRENGLYCLSTELMTAFLAKEKDSAQLWHRRFGHLGFDNLVKLRSRDMVEGLNVPAAAFEAAKRQVCEPCILAKQHREPFTTSEKESTKPLELVHMDLCGPFQVPSLGGSRYLATFLDDYSKLSVIRPIARKSETADVVREVLDMLETQSGERVCIVRSDNGGEYISVRLANYFKGKGIVHQFTAPYTPQQNGAAERLNRTIVEKVRAMLSDAELPRHFWAEAAMTANYVRLRSPVSGRVQTPWELFYGSKPDVSMLRVFGSTAYVHVPQEKRKKLDQVSQHGVFVGYQENTKGWRVWLDSREIVVSRDVVFYERKLISSDRKIANTLDSLEPLEVVAPQVLGGEVTGTVPGTTTGTVPNPVQPPLQPPLEPAEPAAPDPSAQPAGTEEEEAPPLQAAAGADHRYPVRTRQQAGEWWKTAPTSAALLATQKDPVSVKEALAI